MYSRALKSTVSLTRPKSCHCAQKCGAHVHAKVSATKSQPNVPPPQKSITKIIRKALFGSKPTQQNKELPKQMEYMTSVSSSDLTVKKKVKKAKKMRSKRLRKPLNLLDLTNLIMSKWQNKFGYSEGSKTSENSVVASKKANKNTKGLIKLLPNNAELVLKEVAVTPSLMSKKKESKSAMKKINVGKKVSQEKLNVSSLMMDRVKAKNLKLTNKSIKLETDKDGTGPRLRNRLDKSGQMTYANSFIADKYTAQALMCMLKTQPKKPNKPTVLSLKKSEEGSKKTSVTSSKIIKKKPKKKLILKPCNNVERMLEEALPLSVSKSRMTDTLKSLAFDRRSFYRKAPESITLVKNKLRLLNTDQENTRESRKKDFVLAFVTPNEIPAKKSKML